MTSHYPFPRFAKKVSAALLLITLVGAAGASSVTAQLPSRSGKATPAVELNDRQWVRVDWEGIVYVDGGLSDEDAPQSKGLHEVLILQCRQNPDAAAEPPSNPEAPADTRSAVDRNCLPREDRSLNDFGPELRNTPSQRNVPIDPLISSTRSRPDGKGSQMFRVRNSRPECDDGVDNDRDGNADFSTDPASKDNECSSLTDASEDDLPADSSSFYCDSEHPCSLAIVPYDRREFVFPASSETNKNKHFELNFADKVVVPLTFAPAPSCASADESLIGLGDPAIRLAGLRWQRDVCQTLAIRPALVDQSSFQALEAFAAQDETDPLDDVDFIVTTVPPTEEQIAALAEKKITYTVVPIALSGMTVAYNYRSFLTGRVFDLRMTPRLTAAAVLESTSPPFGSQLQAIQKDPNSIYRESPLVNTQAGEVAGNRSLTSWLASDTEANDYWKSNSSSRAVELPTDILPASSSKQRVTGEETVADLISRLVQIDATPALGQRVGFIYSSTAHFYGLQMAELMNKHPQDNPGAIPDFEFVGPTESGLTKAVEEALAKQTADGGDDEFLGIDYGTDAAGAYPMPVISYMLARTDMSEQGFPGIKKSNDLKSYLTYVLGDGQKVLPAGYAPLPAALVEKGLKATEKISLIPPRDRVKNVDADNAPNETQAAAPTTPAATNSATTPTTTPSSGPATTTAPKSTTTTTRPVAAAADEPAEEEEAAAEEEEEEGTTEEEAAGEEFTPEGDFEESADDTSDDLSSDAVDLSLEEEALAATQEEESLAPRSFPEAIERVIGKLQGSASRMLLPGLLLFGLIALALGSRSNVPAVLKGWNPSFETDLRRRIKELADMRLTRKP